ncbi:hypothetical protein BJX99DRAFT_239890 [Aspergillus californicus]
MNLSHIDYTVAWVCALPLELAAAKSILDEVHHSLPQDNSDHNTYTLGKVSGHNVAVACLPSGAYEKVSAATVVSRMLSTFPAIRFGLMVVGIGGGVPSTGVDVRLGDVVISKPTGNSGGVIQYDYGKALRDGKFQHIGMLNKPRSALLTALSQMESDSVSGRTQVKDILNAVQIKHESTQRYTRPSKDWLFGTIYYHQDDTYNCSSCDQNQLVQRDPQDTDAPFLHYGLIASSNKVVKDAKIRDSIAQKQNILCFEIEAAGFMDKLQPLVIRGICDYCDSHKNEKWQNYAALAAAAYAKSFLSAIPTLPMANNRDAADIKLCEYYSMNYRLGIKRLSGELLDMEQCYINLSIIEDEHNDQGLKLQEKQSSSTFSLLNRLKVKADNPEKEVTLPELFNDRKQPDGRMAQPRRILIRGRAGVGKTTLCKKIVHDFLHRQMWANLYDRIIWIPLRRLKGISRLDEFFYQEYFSSHADPDELASLLRKMAFDPIHKRTVWLLDGLDEVTGYRDPSGVDLTEVFTSLFNETNVIITSRPYAANLPGLAPFDLELETVGFHPSQIDTYVAKTTRNQDVAMQICSFIQKHWLIQGLVRIPIQLDALCYSWDADFSPGDIRQTMTAIYQAIELKLWKKDILQLEKRKEQRLISENEVQQLRTRQQMMSCIGSKMELLEFLAFTGLQNDMIEFHQIHRDQIYNQPEFGEMLDYILDKISFLRTSDAPSLDKSYYFLHLTFQEFFAAQYFVRCWVSEPSKQLICLKSGTSRTKSTIKISPAEFLQREKYSGRYDVFWRFVTGLLYDYDEEQLCIFLKLIQDEPRDLIGPAHQ